MSIRRAAFALFLASFAVGLSAGTLPKGGFSDPFDGQTQVPQRRAQRGDWQIANGVARCTQDDELYKQFKDHGPIIFYDLDYSDATIHFRYKPEECKSFVFTANGAEGHVFRFITSAAGTSLRAFPPGEEKSIQLHRAAELSLPDGQWTDVTVKLQGDTATVTIGSNPAIKVEHASLARPKTNLSVGFAFGACSFADVSAKP
ncbi:MAG: hypothetical protein KDA75_20635 [Planctomycetaceae bacterium]|nr:hypothetical protein [Planctomycetaceae bacterium]